MTTIGKSIITIKTDKHNNIPDLTTDNGIKCLYAELGQKKDGKINRDWDLTEMFRLSDSGGRMKSYKYLSLDLHKLIRIDGEYDRDGSITEEIDPRAIFSSQNNTRAEMIGSRVHLIKPRKVRIDIECWRR